MESTSTCQAADAESAIIMDAAGRVKKVHLSIKYALGTT